MRAPLATACGLAFAMTLPAPMAIADPGACAAITTDADRLACYDREFPRIASQPSGDTPQWQTSSEPSLLQGHTDRRVSRASDGDITCRWSKPRRVQIIVQCKENVTSVAFETGCFMTSSRYRSYGDVTYQLDDGKPRVAPMVAGADNKSLGFWSGDAAIPFLKEMFGKNRLSVKMTPFAEDPVSATFDVTGLEETMKDLRAECGW